MFSQSDWNPVALLISSVSLDPTGSIAYASAPRRIHHEAMDVDHIIAYVRDDVRPGNSEETSRSRREEVCCLRKSCTEKNGVYSG